MRSAPNRGVLLPKTDSCRASFCLCVGTHAHATLAVSCWQAGNHTPLRSPRVPPTQLILPESTAKKDAHTHVGPQRCVLPRLTSRIRIRHATTVPGDIHDCLAALSVQICTAGQTSTALQALDRKCCCCMARKTQQAIMMARQSLVPAIRVSCGISAHTPPPHVLEALSMVWLSCCHHVPEALSSV
jgi:hypothetical protein